MKKYLNTEYDCIFVILGKGCNMRCKYCLQAPYHRQETPMKDLPLVVDFIRDAAANQQKMLNIQFFGGEPLMYINDMKKIVRVLKGTPNLHFSVITNGKALTQELVDYFNENGFGISVSWDGPRSEEIRGWDVVKEKKDLLLQIKGLCMGSILSAYCYPKDLIDARTAFNEEYKAAQGRDINFIIEEFLDTGIEDVHTLLANVEELQGQVRHLVDHYRQYMKGQDYNPAYKDFIEQHLTSVRYAVNRDIMLGSFTRCGDGTRVVNVDLQGNLYKCHNHDVVIGNVKGEFWGVLDKSLLNDNALRHREECLECHVAPLCLGGCALIEDSARKAMCDLHLAYFSPIIDLVMEVSK